MITQTLLLSTNKHSTIGETTHTWTSHWVRPRQQVISLDHAITPLLSSHPLPQMGLVVHLQCHNVCVCICTFVYIHYTSPLCTMHSGEMQNYVCLDTKVELLHILLTKSTVPFSRQCSWENHCPFAPLLIPKYCMSPYYICLYLVSSSSFTFLFHTKYLQGPVQVYGSSDGQFQFQHSSCIFSCGAHFDWHRYPALVYMLDLYKLCLLP